MKYKTLSLTFMVLMLIGFVSTIWLFMDLTKTKNELSALNAELSQKDSLLTAANQDLELMIAAKATADSIRTAELIKLVPEQQANNSELEALKKNAENANFNIGINYKSSGKSTFDKTMQFLEPNGYSIYYTKQDSRPRDNTVIYYSDKSKSKAEELASMLSSSTGKEFNSLRGQSPGSITNSQISKTLLIHIAN